MPPFHVAELWACIPGAQRDLEESLQLTLSDLSADNIEGEHGSSAGGAPGLLPVLDSSLVLCGAFPPALLDILAFPSFLIPVS